MMFLFNRAAYVGLMVAGLLALPVSAQTYNQFDNSANATLHSNYFVREVLVTNLNPDGSVGTALSALGTINFDGAGDYTFNGTVMDSTPSVGEPQQTTRIITGTYGLAPNGFLRIESLLGSYIDGSGATQTDLEYGGVGAAGPNAFVASATENLNYDLMVGIPLGTSLTNASFQGTFNAAYVNLLSADVTQIRDASLQFTADGKGNVGTVAVSGYAANRNSTVLSQSVSGATYSLASITITGGTMNFGGASSNLINGSEAFMVSPDGSLMVGGSLSGYDMLVGTPAIANATPGMYKGFYFLGALEDDASQLASASESSIDAFYGSSSVTGSGGVFINHLRFAQSGYYPLDNTYDDYYSVPANGVFQPDSDADQYMLGANGQIVIMSGTGTWYSLMVGLQAPTYTGSGVFLNPQGVVNAANFAPDTNPVAPLEMVALFGTGIANTDWDATTLPVPTVTPDGVKVLVNGITAPIFRVRASLNPQLIYALVPSSIGPANSVYYATFQVVKNGTPSNSVTLYTNYTAPGVFAASQGGIGDAAALHACNCYSVVAPSDPATVGETVELFVDGLGSVNPPITPDGAAANSVAPFNIVDAYPHVYIDTWDSQVPFAGMAPGYTGLYQVNLTIPSVAAQEWYLNLQAIDPNGLDGGLTSEATIAVGGVTGGASVKGLTPAARQPLRARHAGVPVGTRTRPVSGRLPHPNSEVTQ